MIANPVDILQEKWGYPSFRPLQEDIIHSVLNGQDTLALLPTGGGKSLCFQVPALCQEGVCIVVSPLIALMQDQVRQLQKRNIPAAAIHSGLSYQDIDRIFDNAVYGGIKLLYLSPERLQTDMAKARIPKMPVNLLAIDEAHCISQWGYDFRPSYLNIAEARSWIPDVPVLALTATARPEVAEDIRVKLEFGKTQQTFQKSFLRENLSYVVLQEEGKEEALLRILKRVPGTAIVYVRNRRQTREIATWLRSHSISATHYHAGLAADERSLRQSEWIQGTTRVIVSTNAFGMGIDKPDVRSVVHMDVPDSPEAYFQEAGRAGRDGKRAFAVLIYHYQDLDRLDHQLMSQFPGQEEIRKVYRALGSYFQLAVGSGEGESHPFDLVEFCKVYKLKPGTTHYALKQLEQNGWILLTDPVFRPSNYQIIVGREAVYDYQLRHPSYESILKALLRINAGAFHHPVPIRESQLAKFLRIDMAKLLQGLEAFHRDGIIRYQPKLDQAQIVFLQERVSGDNLLLDRQLIKERKAVRTAQVDAMKAYLEESSCRNRALLEYFGEPYSDSCGICDLCLSKKQGSAARKEIADKLEGMLKEKPRTEQELLASFSSLKKETAKEILDYFSGEGLITRENGLLRWH